MLRQIREMAQAGRYDFYLLRNFGVDSVKKQRKIRAYHKCPPKCVMDNMHIVPQEILEKQKNKKFFSFSSCHCFKKRIADFYKNAEFPFIYRVF